MPELLVRLGVPLDFFISALFLCNFLLIFAVIAFFVEMATILRLLIASRQPWHRYLLLALPAGAALLSFLVSQHGWETYQALQQLHGPYLSAAILLTWKVLIAQASILSMLQVVLAVILYALTLFLEKRVLPPAQRESLWVLTRSRSIW